MVISDRYPAIGNVGGCYPYLQLEIGYRTELTFMADSSQKVKLRLVKEKGEWRSTGKDILIAEKSKQIVSWELEQKSIEIIKNPSARISFQTGKTKTSQDIVCCGTIIGSTEEEQRHNYKCHPNGFLCPQGGCRRRFYFIKNLINHKKKCEVKNTVIKGNMPEQKCEDQEENDKLHRIVLEKSVRITLLKQRCKIVECEKIIRP